MFVLFKSKKITVADFLKMSDKEKQDCINLSSLIDEKAKIIGNAQLKPFKELKYKHVEELMIMQKKGHDIKLIKYLYKANKIKITDKQIIKERLKNFFATINFINKEFDFINKHLKMLNTKTDEDLIHAGIEKLNMFGYINIVDVLAGGDILKWEKVLKLTWWDVFIKLKKNKEEADIRQRLKTQQEMEKRLLNNKTKNIY